MSTTTVQRVFNFSAGPAVLPVSVLEEIKRDMLALPGVGMSVLEISHRSKAFKDILARAEADIRALADIPANYKVLFLQGGASLQFSMVPMNLLGAGQSADYIDCGSWAEKAIKEGKIYADPIQFPDRIGRETVQVIVRYFEGEKVPAEVLIPTALYRKSDAEKDAQLR